jgi:hypothetical protein
MFHAPSINEKHVRRILKRASGKKCWYVSVGGPTLPQFALALGRKIKRVQAIANPAHPRQFRDFEGEVSFFIRCWWRLEHSDSVLVTSIDEEDKVTKGLNRLVGKSLVKVTTNGPAWDLVLEFNGGLTLKAFPNQPTHAEKHLKNWHARVRALKVYAGPGTALELK